MIDPSFSQRVPLILLAAALLIVGCCPWLLLGLIKSDLAASVAAAAH
jgi:NADH-quinone oxidoreductase subunit M